MLDICCWLEVEGMLVPLTSTTVIVVLFEFKGVL